MEIGEITWAGSPSVILIIFDITSFKSYYQNLTYQNDQMLASVTHELNINSKWFRISSSRKKRIIIFELEDTGIGIREEKRSKLFTLFGKIKQDNIEVKKQGVGLELAVSQSLIRAHNDYIPNGEIKVESEFGKGSKFYFSLFFGKILL